MMTMYGYPNRSTHPTCWTCFPMNKLEYTQALLIWTQVWACLSVVSRRCPPNCCQRLDYTRVGHRKMPIHRDLNDAKVMEMLVDGSVDPNKRTTRGHIRPRVKKGSSVIVFTRCNQHMSITFRYANLHDKVTQRAEMYTTSPSFKMLLGDWTVYVLDPVDDMLMVHTVNWEDGGDETGHRIAYVYRWMEEARDFYADNGRIRRTKGMMHLAKVEAPELDESLFDSSMYNAEN